METTKLSNEILFMQPTYKNNHSITYKKNGIYYKLFKDTTKGEIDTKINKIELLNDMGINDQMVLGNIELDGSIVGYSYSVKDEVAHSNFKTLDSMSVNRKTKIEDLDLLKKKLEHFHKDNIIHGDIRLKNVLIGNNVESGKKEIIFRDLDNVSINGSSFGYDSYLQDSYIKRFGINNNLDNMMFNIAVISYLKNVIEAATINYVEECGLPFSLNSKHNIKIMDSMIKLDDCEKIKTLNYKKRH
ncbi:MAG: hypothetical protein J6G98_04175 [Bacilli bacterium]|nr:hypothetical protein [Bacilli bacterium]